MALNPVAYTEHVVRSFLRSARCRASLTVDARPPGAPRQRAEYGGGSRWTSCRWTAADA
jgi:hypothetical protein